MTDRDCPPSGADWLFDDDDRLAALVLAQRLDRIRKRQGAMTMTRRRLRRVKQVKGE